jgi:hypothetical protein
MRMILLVSRSPIVVVHLADLQDTSLDTDTMNPFVPVAEEDKISSMRSTTVEEDVPEPFEDEGFYEPPRSAKRGAEDDDEEEVSSKRERKT